MKKPVTILFSLLMIFGLAACGSEAGGTERPSAENSSES